MTEAEPDPGRRTGGADALVRGWALLGVVFLFANASVRLGARGLSAMQDGLTPVEWLVLVGLTALFLYFEGVRALQRRWVPRVIGRIGELHAGRPLMLRLLAPFYAMSLVGAKRRTLLLSWVGVAAIVAAVVLVRTLPAPWRGIVDVAVASALAWGLAALVAGGMRRGRAWLAAGVLLVPLATAGCAVEPTPTQSEQRASTPAPAPRTHGLDSAGIEGILADAAALPRLRSLVIARHGDIVVERRFRGPSLDTPVNVKSVSKSILSAVVGIVIDDGHLTGPEQPIAAFFERQLGRDADPRKRAITVGHLLSMQSGLERTSGAHYGAWVSSRDWIGYVLSRPMMADPGGTRMYSTGNSHLLSAIVTQATGQSTWAYARTRLAAPLGIELPRWPADPQGIYFGGNEMRLSPRALVQFGELYRNGGRHGGEQVVPEAWVRASLSPRASGRRTGEGYGYGWFVSQVRGHRMFYAWGYGGQFVFVVPALELTVVATSDPDVQREREHTMGVRRLLADGIVPAAQTGAREAGVALGSTERDGS